MDRANRTTVSRSEARTLTPLSRRRTGSNLVPGAGRRSWGSAAGPAVVVLIACRPRYGAGSPAGHHRAALLGDRVLRAAEVHPQPDGLSRLDLRGVPGDV